MIAPYERSVDLSGLRQIMISQYRLHEVIHLRNPEAASDSRLTLEPSVYTLQDVYKCLHQAEFGIGHSIDNPAHFIDILTREIARAHPAAGEPLFETISPNGSQLRINLRPYKQLFPNDEKKTVDLLTEVCLESVKHLDTDGNHFIGTLAGFKELNNRGELIADGITFAFAPQAVAFFLHQTLQLIRQMETIPVFSHSPIYRRMNQPSYRVVDANALKQSSLSFILCGSA